MTLDRRGPKFPGFPAAVRDTHFRRARAIESSPRPRLLRRLPLPRWGGPLLLRSARSSTRGASPKADRKRRLDHPIGG